jgi:predicted nucleotidyltransferase
LAKGRTLFDLAAMRAELEDLLGVPIDVVATSGLEGDVRDEVLAEALAL